MSLKGALKKRIIQYYCKLEYIINNGNIACTSLAISAYAGLRGGVGLSLVKSQWPFLFGL